MLTLTGVEEVRAHVGNELGVTPWKLVTQREVNVFADLTGDHQPAHVDVERAAAGPFGGTIAHGYYTLALGAGFSYTLFSIEGFGVAVNYGLNRVRFPAPLKVGTRVRMRATLHAVTEVPNGIQVVTMEVFEGEGVSKPVCVAEAVARFYSELAVTSELPSSRGKCLDGRGSPG